MKYFLLLFAFISSVSYGQTVRNSAGDGDFFNPLTWAPVGIPGDGDSLFIDHIVTMTVGIPYTMGRITVNSGGTLTDGGSAYDIYCNGGSLVNHGTVTCNDVWLDSGELENYGNMTLDSLWTQGTVYNSGVFSVTDYFHDELTTCTNDGTIAVTNNFLNSGVFYNNDVMTVGNNYSNWNFGTSDATFENDGELCIGNDFSNFNAMDTLRGSGTIWIRGNSTNLGLVQGTLTIHTPTGSFTVNTGSVDGTVTFGTNDCELSIQNPSELQFNLYPNPTNHSLNTEISNYDFEVSDFSGRIVIEGNSTDGSIDVSELETGMYILKIKDQTGAIGVKSFMKN